MKRLASHARRAINDFNMIADGDVIAVGVSGGKDSLTLLAILASLRRYLPQKFDVKALTLTMGYDNYDTSEIAAFCERIEVPYIVKETDIAKVVFDYRQEKNPCALCAKLRRGALNDLAKEEGCNKVALGHHFDDVLETFFLSLFYEARLSCFSAVTYLSRVDLTVIRPMLYIEEHMISSYAKRADLPVLHNPCPADKHTKREYMKQLIRGFEAENKDVRMRIFRAIKEGNLLC